MRRNNAAPRKDWVAKVESQGFYFHSLDSIYWDESAYYSFTLQEISELERVTQELYDMCLEACQYIIDNNLFERLRIPKPFVPLIVDSWNNEDPAIYGRFDLRNDGINPPKMYEFNADTPTSLLEAAVIQWYWLQDFDSSADQFNSIHEKLIAYWQYLKPYLYPGYPIHFTCMQNSVEDYVTTQYMRDTCSQAGYETISLDITQIGWDSDFKAWRGEKDEAIKSIFKLYPWEWLIHEQFGENLLQDQHATKWIEPPFKLLLSNKGLLPILWQMYPNHPNLLPAFFEDDSRVHSISGNCAIKPLLSREGANVRLRAPGILEETKGEYGEEGVIYQEVSLLPTFERKRPVIGSWIIGQEAAGIGIREGDGYITTNTSRFIPHLIKG